MAMGAWRADYDGPMIIASSPRVIGDRVIIHGLVSKPELNGCVAHRSGGKTVDSSGVERIQIRTVDGHNMRIKSNNVRMETPEEWMTTVVGNTHFFRAWSPAEYAYILRTYSGHVQAKITHTMLIFLIGMGFHPERLPEFKCINHEDAIANVLEFLAADGASGVVRALYANAKDEKVAEVGFSVLSMLCVGGEPRLKAVHATATVRDAGAAAAAVHVLKALPTAAGKVTEFQNAPKLGAVQNACRFLASLIRGDDGDEPPDGLTPFQINVYDAGGLQTLLDAMSQNPASPEVMRDALKAVGGLVWTAGERLTGSHKIASIVAAALPGMSRCLGAVAVQSNGCNALNNALLEFHPSEWSGSSAPLAKAAVAAMGAHKDETGVLVQGCMLLRSLACSGFVQDVRDAGAEQVVARVLRKYGWSTFGEGKALYGLAQAVAAAITDRAIGNGSIADVVEALADANFGNDGGADLVREVPRCAGCGSITAKQDENTCTDVQSGRSGGGSQTLKLKQCSRCKQVWYCSRSCQGAHWKAHKADCRRLASEAALLARDAVD